MSQIQNNKNSKLNAILSKITSLKTIAASVIVTLLIITSVTSLPVLANSIFLSDKILIDENEQTVSTISYKPNIKIEDSINNLKKIQTEGASIKSITSSFRLKNQTVTDFLYGGDINKNIDNAKKDLKEKRLEFAKNLDLKNIELNKFTKNSGAPISNDEKINLNELSKQDIFITEVSLLGKKSNLDSIKSKFKNIENINEVKVKNFKQRDNFGFINSLTGTVKANASYEYGIPKGTITYFGNGGLASEDYGTTRYNFNYMYWDKNNFGYNDTYEHEVYLFKGNNGTYLATDNSYGRPLCFINTKYASSTLPEAYIDTRLDQNGLCDNEYGSEPSFTIGSSNPANIPTNQWQYTYMSLNRGTRDIPVFKTQAQIGYHFPNRGTPGTALGTWTSFGHSEGTYRLIYDYANNNYITNPNYNSSQSAYIQSYYR